MIKVTIMEHPEKKGLPKSEKFMAFFQGEAFKGMLGTGPTALKAFDELMTSLKVKIAYDNNLQL